jgi:hypothetical protein
VIEKERKRGRRKGRKRKRRGGNPFGILTFIAPGVRQGIISSL